jgi:16S rRNA (guanine966-N2)-methyltransferase
MLRIIAGKWKNRKLQTLPDDKVTRPTADRVRESVFNILQSTIPGAHVLDLFSGTGALGLEALSRGAASAVFVESNPIAVKLIRQNINTLDVPAGQATVVQADATLVLQQPDRWQLHEFAAQVIFADPPYASNWYERALDEVGNSELCSKNCTLCLEMNGYTELVPHIEQLWEKQSRRIYGKTAVEFWTRTDR